MTKYKVKSGDNLSLIAKQNNVSVEDLISANNIKDKNKISINQELIIPESKRLEGKEYVIKKGDTLYDISKKFNVGVNAVKKANEIKSDDIFAGDKIVIPENLSKAIIKENKNLKETFKITKKKEDNLKTINDFHSKNKEDYVVIDKKKGKLLLYNNGELKQTLDVGTGKGTSDIITGLTGITNNQTGAGIYTIAKQEEFQDLVNNPKNKKLYGKNILGYKNESGQVQGSFLHQIPEGNEERYGKIDRGNTHFSQGCINCKKKDFEQVVSNIKPNTKMYILPEEDDNVFEVKNNRLNFTTTKPKNIRGYNFTYDDKGNYLSDKVRQSTYKPLIIPKEKLKYAVFDNRNTSKQYEILQKNKESLMKDLNVDSDTYDTLAKQLMGHVKQETGSSYIRDVGERAFNNFLDVSNISIPNVEIPFTDKKLFGNKSGKTYTAENSSRGDLQIRYNQIPENVRKKYGVNSPDDLDDIEKAIKVGMFLKKDGLQQVISKRDKLDNLTRENLTDFVPYQYNQAKLLQKNDTNPEKNRYVQNVLNFSNNLKQYGGNSENNMEQIVQAYIQQAGLNQQQAQQLMQELQALDETQLQQVLGKMQQQLQGESSTEAMQYGGKPLVTSNPKDPRLQGYRDSLALYNNYKQLESELKKQGYEKELPTDRGYEKGDIYKQLKRSQEIRKTWTPEKAKKYGDIYEDDTKKVGNLYSTNDFIRGVINPTLPRQLYSYDIKPKSTDSYAYRGDRSILQGFKNIAKALMFSDKEQDVREGDRRMVGNYDNVKPKQVVQYQEPKKGIIQKGSLMDSKSKVVKTLKEKVAYSIPKYPELEESESIVNQEFNIDSVDLPSEEQYIPFINKQREYTTGQESYELNSDYVRRMHELQKGNKQAPKLIRNQYGGYEKWKKALPKNLQSTDTTLYNLRGAYEGGLIPEMTEDGLYHLGSRNPKTGELLKSPKHPTFNKMIEGEAQAGYEVYEKNGKLYSRPKSKQQYGGIPVDEDGVFSTGKNPVVVPTRGTGKISMEGVDFPIDSYDADTMQYLETMQPNQQYQFEGVDNVLEIPQAKFGIQKMQMGGNIAMDNNRLWEYEYKLDKDESPIGKKYQKKLDETFDALATDKLNVKEYFKQREKLIQEYLANKHKNDKPVNYLNTSKKYPVKASDFKSYPASNPVEVIGNSNLRVGNKVDTVGGTPVRDFGITNKNSSKKDEYGFITGLKPMTTKKEMLPVYKESWVEEWNAIDPNFKNKTFAQQQAFAKNWVKTNARNYYDGLSNSFQGYNIDKLTADNKFGSITNQLRPSFAKPNLPNGEEPVPNFVDAGFPVESGNSQPTKYTGTVDNTPIALPQESKFSFEDAVNPADAIIGKLDNRDMSGRYLSNMKLRNNEIKLPYFQQVDLKTPQLYQQDITPYINNLYTGYNSAAQNIDMNSAVGQAQALQLNANLDKSINDISGSVYNQNLKAAIDWENQLTGIYNQQSQLDNQNRAAYSDGVDLVRTNKQNVDNQIDALAYEHKMKQIQNQNNMMLSTLLHPDFYTTDEGNGQMMLKRKYNPAPKANTTNTNDELEYWKKLALENSKTKVAKYGIGKKKAMC